MIFQQGQREALQARIMTTVVFAVVMSSCGSTSPPPEQAFQEVSTQEAPAQEEATREAPDAQVTNDGSLRCLPVVNGCGCAYVCGHAISENADGSFEVVHDFQDSATTNVVIARWCFDDAGRGSPESTAPSEAHCKDVFDERSSCGGECIPTTEFLSCHIEEGNCVP